MKLLKWLFGSKKEKKSPFAVEYYPLSGKYYPTYKGNYLSKCYSSGIYETKDNIIFADYKDTEQGAEKIISEFKEQHFKVNVKIIQK